MNVKIENQKLRFRITEEELKDLLKMLPVYAKVVLLDKMIVVTINPQGRDEVMVLELVLDAHDAYLNLLVPPSIVQELSSMGQSRDGLRQNIGGISVSLQVYMPEACYT